MQGSLLGNYRILEQLGEGGMGVVYVGRHEALGHRVAVKVLQPEMSSNAAMVQRFFNEAQAATAIRNPGIVQVFDFGTTPNGRAYFVMELLEGETLTVRLARRRQSFEECCRLGRQVANVLQAAHAAGITHRDLKPDNLFLVADPEVIGGERVKVLDFGIAKLAGEAQSSGMKTRTGLFMGTPDYMSPEQCRSASTAEARSDIYSLGCILFEMACGRPPFVGEGMGDIVAAHLHVPPPDPQSFAPAIPAELSALITQMLAKRPDARPQTMAAVSQSLDGLLRELSGRAMRPTAPAPLPSQPAAQLPPMPVPAPPPPALGRAPTPLPVLALSPMQEPALPPAIGRAPTPLPMPSPLAPSGPGSVPPSGPLPMAPSGPSSVPPSGPLPMAPSGPSSVPPSGSMP
ncbi:MAG TPA: protein kinase, partial [Kofleriaceae bacterium]|nr:protein kinase [Kofleriaceae bacterium]